MAILNGYYFQGIVREAQLRNYGQFMEDYASQLQEIENAIDDHRTGETWDFTLDPIALQVNLSMSA